MKNPRAPRPARGLSNNLASALLFVKTIIKIYISLLSMLPVNFNHLYYFWVITKAGGISAARGQLLLSQSTLSLQIKQLERSVGRRLFWRGRHGMTLTADGKLAFDYCERIFSPALGFKEKLQ